MTQKVSRNLIQNISEIQEKLKVDIKIQFTKACIIQVSEKVLEM